MLEDLLRTDNLSLLLLCNSSTVDIFNLMFTCKVFYKFLISSDIWKYNLMKYEYDNQITKIHNDKKRIEIYNIIDIPIPCDFYNLFMNLYEKYAYIPDKANFRLSIGNLRSTVNNKLMHIKVGDVHILQSIRELDWQYD